MLRTSGKLPVWLKQPRSEPPHVWSRGDDFLRTDDALWCRIGEAAGWSEVIEVLTDHAEQLFLQDVLREPGLEDAGFRLRRCACLDSLHHLYGSSLEESLTTASSRKVDPRDDAVLYGFLVDLSPGRALARPDRIGARC